jgi:hypothetical protein
LFILFYFIFCECLFEQSSSEEASECGVGGLLSVMKWNKGICSTIGKMKMIVDAEKILSSDAPSSFLLYTFFLSVAPPHLFLTSKTRRKLI